MTQLQIHVVESDLSIGGFIFVIFMADLVQPIGKKYSNGKQFLVLKLDVDLNKNVICGI